MFHGLYRALFLKSMLSELLDVDENVDIVARIRNDNSSVVDHVHSIKSVTRGRRLDGFLETNRERMWKRIHG